MPPSWSTSLASAGFTEEEIAAIQARRAAGVRSPPDMRYLYNDRPQSPATAAFAQGVPVLTHPLPRSTSLHRLAPSAANPEPASPPRPTLPNINTSTPDNSSSVVASTTSTPLSTRKPPPRRKPPSPREEDLEQERKRAHKAGQASQSTMAHSEEYSGSS